MSHVMMSKADEIFVRCMSDRNHSSRIAARSTGSLQEVDVLGRNTVEW